MASDDRGELAAAVRHARETVFPVAAGRRCIDSRYEPGQGSGAIARPGADFGYVMALLAVNHARGLGWTAARLVDAVCDALTRAGDRFYLHTDRLSPWPSAGNPDRPAIGCRHIAAAVDPEQAPRFFPPSYRTPDADVRAALARVANRAAGGAVEVVTLRGEGVGRGVLVVVGTGRTVHPAAGDAAYFVYDQARDEAFLARVLVPRLGIPGLPAAEVAAAARAQLGATLRAAAPGRPVFLVDADGAVPDVAWAGRVEAVFPDPRTVRRSPP